MNIPPGRFCPGYNGSHEKPYTQLGQSLLDRRGESLKELGLGSDEGLTEEGEYLRGLLVGLT